MPLGLHDQVLTVAGQVAKSPDSDVGPACNFVPYYFDVKNINGGEGGISSGRRIPRKHKGKWLWKGKALVRLISSDVIESYVTPR